MFNSSVFIFKNSKAPTKSLSQLEYFFKLLEAPWITIATRPK